MKISATLLVIILGFVNPSLAITSETYDKKQDIFSTSRYASWNCPQLLIWLCEYVVHASEDHS